MDINCILPCLHQVNGKCALVVVPDFVSLQPENIYDDCNCAYFQAL